MRALKTLVATRVIVFAPTGVAMAGVGHFDGYGHSGSGRNCGSHSGGGGCR